MGNCAKVGTKKVNLGSFTDVITQVCPCGKIKCAIWHFSGTRLDYISQWLFILLEKQLFVSHFENSVRPQHFLIQIKPYNKSKKRVMFNSLTAILPSAYEPDIFLVNVIPCLHGLVEAVKLEIRKSTKLDKG